MNLSEEADPPQDAFDDVAIDPDIADLAAMFLHAKKAEIGTLRSTLERGDFRLLRQAGHNLAGSGGGYGFPRLSALGAALSAAARAEDSDAVRETLNLLSRYLAVWTRRYG